MGEQWQFFFLLKVPTLLEWRLLCFLLMLNGDKSHLGLTINDLLAVTQSASGLLIWNIAVHMEQVSSR